MKKFIYITIFGIFTLISCSKKEDLKVYDVIKERELIFPIDKPENGNLKLFFEQNSLFDYAIIDGIETLIIPININRLAFYDLATQKEYHSVPLLPNRTIRNFSYINK